MELGTVNKIIYAVVTTSVKYTIYNQMWAQLKFQIKIIAVTFLVTYLSCTNTIIF